MAYATRGALLKRSNIIKCSLCLDTFKGPKILPCTHTFCLPCLETYCHDKPQHEMSCPLCRKVFIIPSGGFTNLTNHCTSNSVHELSITTDASASTGQTPVKIESVLNACSFLDNTGLLGVIPAGKASFRGLTVLSSQLFVISWSTQVSVYDTSHLTLTRKITITDSSSIWAIVASSQYNCLYISDVDRNVVFRYNLSDDVISSWSVDGGCYGLSLTSTHNVLVTLWITKQIKEYTPEGSLVREISLDGSIEHAWHSIQLSSGQFVVCHGAAGSPLYRICAVDTSGRIIQCYGGPGGSGIGQLNVPTNLAVDRQGNVLVADWANDRVVLLSPLLTHLGYITIPGNTLSRPYALHLDLHTHRLYIGEHTDTERVFVLTV